MKKRIFVFIITSLLLSIVILITYLNYNNIDVDNNNIPSNSKISYFPEKTFPRIESYGYITSDKKIKREEKIIKNEYDTIIKNYISENLYEFKEPLLYNYDSGKEIYRFTWLRSFHNPIVIRIEIASNKKTIFWKELKINKEYKPIKIITDTYKPLDNEKWTELENLLKKENFWEIYPNINVLGNDGSFWVLEGTKDKKYKAVAFWSPKRNKIEYFELCKYILALTDLKIDEYKIY
ncbi:hypothetical protein [Flavobacterium sp.]|uniref:hypothetical protein n=1 Tax=Flavobacterium sp. TaxID=239 RepID=UPI004048844A